MITHLLEVLDMTMARMFRVLGFLSLLFSLMALWGNLGTMSLLLFAQTSMFITLGYLNLTEKSYMYIFAIYCVFSFMSFFIYSFFFMPPSSV